MNEPCRAFVNKSSCEFCVYHIQREYQKSSSKRADIQSSFTRVDPKRRLQERVLGKDQVSRWEDGTLFVFHFPSSSLPFSLSFYICRKMSGYKEHGLLEAIALKMFARDKCIHPHEESLWRK